MERKDIPELIFSAQRYISENYASLLTSRENISQLKSYIEKYIRDNKYEVDGFSFEELTEKIFSEMAEYSILTPYLYSPDLEEININSWNDIALTYLDGRIEKVEETFNSPKHGVDIIKRLLQHSGMIIDNANPIAQGHLPPFTTKDGTKINTRITAIKDPVADKDCGICVSIRLLHPQRIDKDELVRGEFASKEMLDFLCMCLRYGISIVIAGATSSGKTTLLNAMLQSVPDKKRIFSIESGSRELSLLRIKNGKVTNNVVQTLSRPSDNAAYDISQENLVVASLRFNPDIVAVGEMRDVECYSAVEASLTGHTVISTVHSGAGDAAHMRISLLCQKRFPIDFNTSLIQSAQGFPLVVFTQRLENNSRKIMDISECEILNDGKRRYRTLYKYSITDNTITKDGVKINGYFSKPEDFSDGIKTKLIQFGVAESDLEKYKKKQEGR